MCLASLSGAVFGEFKCCAFILILYYNRQLYAFQSCILCLILYHHSILHNCAWILKGEGRNIVKEGIFAAGLTFLINIK